MTRKEAYQLLFAEVFSMDRAKRIRQVRELAAEFIKKRVTGVISAAQERAFLVRVSALGIIKKNPS